ncbi:hypothetical protein EVAR_31754_1 [Eumeta japonica]|uniref:Uncharacterized protein n=1 Tax=Eumeta variegata TaxID=151549 RepID=A0A4C1W5Q0_EUMVA|nr:hypothetical protein EVAR_31754_1 [Eumeta japonica]
MSVRRARAGGTGYPRAPRVGVGELALHAQLEPCGAWWPLALPPPALSHCTPPPRAHPALWPDPCCPRFTRFSTTCWAEGAQVQQARCWARRPRLRSGTRHSDVEGADVRRSRLRARAPCGAGGARAGTRRPARAHLAAPTRRDRP